MDETRTHVAIVIGSTRKDRLGPAVSSWIEERATARNDFSVDVIDLAEEALPAVLKSDEERPSEVAALATRLSAADAFIVVTPEYNHSFPASLKLAIDWFYDEWAAKAIGFVSYGGISGGLRAVEHLRLVFVELGAVNTRESVSFQNIWEQFDSDGRIVAQPEANEAAQRLFDDLARWALASRPIRTNPNVVV